MLRVRQVGAYIDLTVSLDEGRKIVIDAEWTDYWSRASEGPPVIDHWLDAEGARRCIELAGRLRQELESSSKRK